MEGGIAMSSVKNGKKKDIKIILLGILVGLVAVSYTHLTLPTKA